MLKPALEIGAFTDNPLQQIIQVTRDNVTEYHGAYTPRGGNSRQQADEICAFLDRHIKEKILNGNVVAARVFAETPEDLKTFLAAQKSLFKEIPPQTQLRTKPIGAKIAYQFEVVVRSLCRRFRRQLRRGPRVSLRTG